MDFNDLLNLMVEKKSSDLFITDGVAPSMKINGQIVPISKNRANSNMR
ncbi:type IV pili twitching motility protein PilT, partial [Acinetobacter baumannii]